MVSQEKREDARMRILKQLKRKVRPHRPAAKVLEMSIAMQEERLEMMEEQKAEQEWQLSYLKELDPKKIEPDVES